MDDMTRHTDTLYIQSDLINREREKVRERKREGRTEGSDRKDRTHTFRCGSWPTVIKHDEIFL